MFDRFEHIHFFDVLFYGPFCASLPICFTAFQYFVTHFYSPWKRQKIRDFQVILRGEIEVNASEYLKAPK